MSIRQYMPSEEEAERARREYEYAEAVIDFWDDHHEELLALYPEQYVAVKDPLGDYKVVATDKNIVSLIDAIEAMGYDRREIEIEKVTAKIPAPMPILG